MQSEELIHIRRALHQIPELGFEEFETQKYLLAEIEKLDQTNLIVETWKTGILVFLKGKSPQKTIGYRADIDGLPIKEETNLPFSSNHPGKMHACGHDFHMTIAFGLLAKMVENRPQNNLLFIFQPAEEGPGGAKPLLESDVFKLYEPDIILALHVAPELPTGSISCKPGILFANTSELFIDFKGKGGHAAYPHLTKDMIVAASAFVTQLQQIVSRKVNPLDSAVVTIGKITGGTVQNVIAEEARIEGTIRTLQPETMIQVKKELQNMVQGFESIYDCSIQVDYGANYYQVSNDKKYVDIFRDALNSSDLNWVEAREAMTGEDFGYFLKEIPGLMFWLGINSEFGLHHSKLNPDEKAINVGISAGEKMIAALEE
ncbi:N-acetyldiaminopimelate deacetylase [Saliterribacillus persicus]|uniref:N-acetyldiaminopimelate deacetylase n=1 Tax=Saliterribacillus persicus TaxID=930114 RepID=A0A368XXS4_9BACI|nr:N-acetyldiaminopimelate deacetylase [Saliterribacillus persicus]RCW71838.1 N-acetyldiaminopimelate deacetylase [Saliterribacillus persicus]